MYELSKSRLQSHSLMEIGIDFRYGYEIAPLQCIQQVLWFHLETNCANTSRVPSQTHYWIEYASGAVALLRLNDLECSPERFLSSLADLNPDDCDDHTLTDRLQRNWLIPPEFRVVSIPAALLYPNRAFIWQAVKEQLSAMLRILVKLATNNASKLAGDNASTCPLQKELQAES